MEHRRHGTRVIAALCAALGAIAFIPASQAATPDPSTPIEEIIVDSSNIYGTTSATTLQAGTWYVFEVGGVYNDPHSLTPQRPADAECSNVPPEPSWQPNRYGAVGPLYGAQATDDPMDVYVDGRPADWLPVADGPLCDTVSHVYRITYQPPTSRQINFKVFDPFWIFDNVGTLSVKILLGNEPIQGPDDVPVQTVSLDVTNANGQNGLVPLAAGQTYRIVAGGTFLWDYRVPGNQADAECSRSAADATWKTDRFLGAIPGEDLLDLYVNNAKLDWVPLSNDGAGCNTSDHLYRVIYRPSVSGIVNFRIRATFYGYMSGNLSIRIFLVKPQGTPNPGAPNPPPSPVPLPVDTLNSRQQATGTPLATITVDAANPAGADTPTLQANRFYLLEASGSYLEAYTSDLGRLGDAECTKLPPDPAWQPNRYGVVGRLLTSSTANDDPQDLYVDGRPVDWQPVTEGPVCDGQQHLYQLTFAPVNNAPVNLRIFDPFCYCDNAGALTVKVFAAGEPVSGPSDTLIWTGAVDSANANGTTAPAPLVGGQTYRIVAGGSFQYDYRTAGNEADAECSRSPSDSTWRVDRFAGLVPGEDLLDLYVNNAKQAWTPLSDDGTGCNTRDRLYRMIYRPSGSGLVNLRVMSTFYGFMAGSMTVRIYLVRPTGGPQPETPDPNDQLPIALPFRRPAEGTPAATLSVDATSPAGVLTPPLEQGESYLLEVSGSYLEAYNADVGRLGDAECTKLPPDPGWLAHRYDVLAAAASGVGSSQIPSKITDDPQDLYLNGAPVEWQPVGTSAGCDTNLHTYQLELTPSSTAPVRLSVFDPFCYCDNAGGLTVKIFETGEPVNAGSDVLVGTASVNASNSNPAVVPTALVAGREYRIVVTGTYLWDYRTAGNQADAECTTTASDSTWRPDRFTGLIAGEDLLDLYVNDARVDWMPLTDDGTGCNAAGHAYRINFTPATSGPLTLRVKATFYGYISGTLAVRIFLRMPSS